MQLTQTSLILGIVGSDKTAMFLLALCVLESPNTQEHQEYSRLVVECPFTSNTLIEWYICINNQQITLCTIEGTSSCSGTHFQFTGRVKYLEAYKIEVINMTRHESGTLSCYDSSDGPIGTTTLLYKAIIIGKYVIGIINNCHSDELELVLNLLKAVY